uniref:Vacuolar protein sorting 55 n=1 Tax=Kalanchoe fedtschenkoi TaxID=63787 RepID=A0A7N0TLA2_KALFE
MPVRFINGRLTSILSQLLTNRKACFISYPSVWRNCVANFVMMYVLLPMPLLFFAGSEATSIFSESTSGWADATKFLTGASAVGSIAIPVILKHAGVIGWGALAMTLSSFFIFVLAIVCFIQSNSDEYYSSF